MLVAERLTQDRLADIDEFLASEELVQYSRTLWKHAIALRNHIAAIEAENATLKEVIGELTALDAGIRFDDENCLEYCQFCPGRYDYQVMQFAHTPNCPIARGRELTKETTPWPTRTSKSSPPFSATRKSTAR